MCINVEGLCLILSLLQQPFSSRDFAGKLEVIRFGRPTPELPELKSTFRNVTRCFHHDTSYKERGWLAGCSTLNKLFCWPCLLFDKTIKPPWTTVGYADLNNFTNSCNRHQVGKTHLLAVTELHRFGNTRIDLQLNQQRNLAIQAHNQQVGKNREILLRFIDVTCFLGKQELAFRGHDESEGSSNRGNYIELLTLLQKYDTKLEIHLQTATVFKGYSKHIQNDLIDAVQNVIMNSIKEEVKRSPFVAVLLDETSDVSHLSQLSTVLRYCTEEEVLERFIGFTDVSKSRTASVLCGHVECTMDSFECGDKLVGQGYDGAAVMKGHLNGLQAQVKEIYPFALFIHCCAHVLNLVLSKVSKKIEDCRWFFLKLNNFASYFAHSTIRTAALDEIVRKRFPRIVPTRWCFASRLVSTVHYYRLPLTELFQTIMESPEQWDDDAINVADGLFEKLYDFKFIFMLNVHNTIFSHTDIMYEILQKRGLEINICVARFEAALTFMQEQRDSKFDETYQQTITDVGPPPQTRKRCTLDTRAQYIQLYNEIYDLLITQMRVRFKALKKLKFIELLNCKEFLNYKQNFPELTFTSLKKSYGKFFDFVKLKNELCVIYSSEDFYNMSVKEIYEYLGTGLKDAFSELNKLCQLVLTLPSTTVSVESTFSALKRIKDYKRNTMLNERLTGLSLISIEKRLLQKLRSKDNFCDLVIEQFLQKERRMDFTYK